MAGGREELPSRIFLSTPQRFSYSHSRNNSIFSGAGPRIGLGELEEQQALLCPRQGRGLLPHPWIWAGKASPGSWHLWEGRNSAELLEGFLPREAAGSMRMGQGENTRGTSQTARKTVLVLVFVVIKISPSHSCARSVPPPGATISEPSLLVTQRC